MLASSWCSSVILALTRCLVRVFGGTAQILLLKGRLMVSIVFLISFLLNPGWCGSLKKVSSARMAKGVHFFFPKIKFGLELKVMSLVLSFRILSG